MQRLSPTFAALAHELDRHVARFAQRRNRAWVTMRARTGRLVLFESWLRHEVPANRDARERVSISFNYNWF